MRSFTILILVWGTKNISVSLLEVCTERMLMIGSDRMPADLNLTNLNRKPHPQPKARQCDTHQSRELDCKCVKEEPRQAGG
jgi:hypothetical protein